MSENEAVFTVRGLVLRTTDVGDNDRMLTVLTVERGKLSVFARGVRKVTAVSLSACQPYAYADFTLKSGREFCFLREASVYNTFGGLCDTLSGSALAAYLCSIADDMSFEDGDFTELLQLTMNALWCISEKKKSEYVIKAGYELRAATIEGYQPDIQYCCLCGREHCAEGFVLDIMDGQLFCKPCYHKMYDTEQNKHGYRGEPMTDGLGTALIPREISEEELSAMQFIISAPAKRQFSFSVPEDKITNFSTTCEHYLLHHVEHGYKTLDYYRSVDAMNRQMAELIASQKNRNQNKPE